MRILILLLTLISVTVKAGTPEIQITTARPVECNNSDHKNVLTITNVIAEVTSTQDRLDIALQFAPGFCLNTEFVPNDNKVDAYLMGNFGQEMLDIATNPNKYSLTFVRLNYSELQAVQKYKIKFYQHGFWQTKIWTFKLKITKTSDSKIQIELN